MDCSEVTLVDLRLHWPIGDPGTLSLGALRHCPRSPKKLTPLPVVRRELESVMTFRRVRILRERPFRASTPDFCLFAFATRDRWLVLLRAPLVHRDGWHREAGQIVREALRAHIVILKDHNHRP
jgi:hypothetical protein